MKIKPNMYFISYIGIMEWQEIETSTELPEKAEMLLVSRGLLYDGIYYGYAPDNQQRSLFVSPLEPTGFQISSPQIRDYHDFTHYCIIEPPY